MIATALFFTSVLMASPVVTLYAKTPTPTQSKKADSITATPSPEPVPMAKKPDYPLPYPGILPDHPLYFLKQLRDAILDKLIVDPQRRVEFQILQGDKRLAMGMTLVDKGNTTLAEQVISKGEVYLELALGTALGMQGSGKAIPGYLVERLQQSSTKHIEEIEVILTKAPDAVTSGFTQSLERAKRVQIQANGLK